MISGIRKWWMRSVWNDVRRMYRTFPFTTKDSHEKQWRTQYFREMWATEWKLFRLRPIFVIFYFWDQEKRKRRGPSRMFYQMHHPASGTRQLADWRRLGPHNPPPVVRRTLMRQASLIARQ